MSAMECPERIVIPHSRMTDVDRVIGDGLVALPLYGILTFFSALDPHPDTVTDHPGWSPFITNPHYLVGHPLGTALGLVCAVLGTAALGARLVRGRSSRLALVAVGLTVLGHSAFLSEVWSSKIAATGLEPDPYAPLALGIGLIGNILLGIAVWRSDLPKGAAAIWIVAALVQYAVGMVAGAPDPNGPPIEPLGAALAALGGGWIASTGRSAKPAPTPTRRAS